MNPKHIATPYLDDVAVSAAPLFHVKIAGQEKLPGSTVRARWAGQAATLAALDYAREQAEINEQTFVRVDPHPTDDSRAVLSLDDVADDPDAIEFVARPA